MRILHLSSEKTWRGGEQQIAYLLEELSSKGIHNEVLCKSKSEFEKHCIENHISYHSIGFAGILSLIRDAIILKRLAANFDIVHLHTSKAHSLAYYAFLAGSNATFVLSRRVDFRPGAGVITLRKYSFKGIRKILCVSEAIRHVMLNYLGESYENKLVTVHSGVDLKKSNSVNEFDLRKEFGLAHDVKIIGNTSAIADHKDYFTFIDTAELLIKSGMKCKFFILGDGPLAQQIKKYSLSKSLDKQVIFTGFVQNPLDYLRQFDAFLITSKTEGLGTSIIDAFANKIPVVATRAGGIPELVIHNKTGFLCEVGNSKGLKDAIKKVLEDDKLKLQLTKNATSHLKKFTKEETARKTLEVYQELTN